MCLFVRRAWYDVHEHVCAYCPAIHDSMVRVQIHFSRKISRCRSGLTWSRVLLPLSDVGLCPIILLVRSH